MDIVDFAKLFATEKHKGQKRKDGKDYITHPLAVGNLVEKHKKSKYIKRLIAAAYLHDVLEDTETTYYELVDTFGYDIASLVLEVTTNPEMKQAIGKEKYLAFQLKHITSYALVIKLCDRLHNVSDLENVDEEFRTRYVKETKYIIEYLENNRNLTNTHRSIIKDIKKEIENL